MELLSQLSNNLTKNETILKSNYDDRNYLTKELDNGMRIIWVHDKNAVKSAASMVAGVGHFSDGKIKGMAHLLEHMLFMGSSKYKDVDYYSKKISEYGGISNAYTAHNHTNYYFDVANEHLLDTLDVFSRFFIDPLLDKSCIDKEKNAVDSEHDKNILNDVWRHQEMTHFIGKSKMPFSTFSTGNLETFDVKNLHKHLKIFYDTYYSSDIMTLVIVSNRKFNDVIHDHTIDDVCTWNNYVTNIFNQVPNNNIRHKINKEYAYDVLLECNNNYIEMVPIKDEDIVRLLWEIPYVHEQINTYNFISHMLGHEGQDTLIYILRKKLWIDNISVFYHEPVGNNFLFEIKIKISPTGKKHVTEIIKLTMEFIEIIKNNGIKKELYDEYAITKINDFVQQDKVDGIDCSSILSAVANYALNVQNEPIQNIVIREAILHDFTNELKNKIIKILDTMNTQRINVIASSHIFKNCTKSVEKYYGIEYTKSTNIYIDMLSKIHRAFNVDEEIKSDDKTKLIDTLDEKTIHMLQNDIICDKNEQMKVPLVNAFIATDFKIKNKDFSQKYTSIIKSHGISVYYKPHSEQRKIMSQSALTCIIETDWLDMLTEKGTTNIMVANIYIGCFLKSINDILYMFNLASYSVSAYISENKLIFNCSGFNDKLNIVVKTLIDKFINPSFDKTLFEHIKETYVRQLLNEIFLEPYSNIFELLNKQIKPMHKSRDEKLKMLKSITFEQVINVPSIILNETKTNVKTIVLGNVTLDDAVMLSNNFTIFVSEHMQPKDPKLLKINSEKTFETISEAYNSKETNSAVFRGYKICEITYNINELQIEKDNWLYYICVVNILDSLISRIYFDQLRTIEQLGYITKALPKVCGHNARPVMSYGFLVQSSHTKSEQLFNRIDAFLKGEDYKNKGCLNILNDVTDEEYNNSVESLRAPLSKDHESFLDEEIYYMTVIGKGHDIFDLRERENKMYGTVTKQDIINFYQKYFRDEPIIWSVGIDGN